MKKLLLALLLCPMLAGAQTQDLVALAKGEFLGMNALFDEKGNLFGYISLYDHGISGNRSKNFEYVLLDKNLNAFANKIFEGDVTAGDYNGYMNYDGKIILRPSRLDVSLVDQKDIFTPSSMVINLKDNSIKKKVFYDFDHGKFKEILQHNSWTKNSKDLKTEKKENGYNYISSVLEIKEGGYLILEYDDYGAYAKNNSILRYNDSKKEIWRYEYNKNGSKTESQILFFLDKDEHHFFGLLRDRVKRNTKYYLVVLDMKTGKEIHKKEISDPDQLLETIQNFPTFSYGSLDNDRTFDDKIVMTGVKGFELYITGFSRLIINKKTFDTDLKFLSYKDDFPEHLPKISAYGSVENGYMLNPKDIYFLKDGSVGMLFEKYKPSGGHTTDMVHVHTDKDFRIKSVKVLVKEKSKWDNSDYLFSQNLNNDNDVVFFYRDYQKDDETKDKNWNLFINTFIDGKFKQEMIPISSKENFFIYPYIAKEGYILLQEFNKKAKYNQVRLERLNY